MPAELICFETACRTRYPLDKVIYNCPKCGGLLEVAYPKNLLDVEAMKKLFRVRRMSNTKLDQSGVWRYRELINFADKPEEQVVTLREGNTPLLDAPRAATYGELDKITFKHQGFNPTGSFKDNGITA